MAVFYILFSMALTEQALAKTKGQSALDRGTQLYKQGRYLEAVKYFEEATKLNPGLLKAWKNLGRAHFKSGKTNEALLVWKTILKIEPGDQELQNSVGFILMAKGQWRRAIPYLEKSLKTDSSQNIVRLRLGSAYKETGQYNRAILLLEQALNVQPDKQDILILLADTYEIWGRRDRAISIYEKFLPMHANDLTENKKSGIVRRLSILLARQADEWFHGGQFHRAEMFYKQALSWEPDNYRILLNLGWTLEKQGKYHEAIYHWKKVASGGDASIAHQIADAYFHLEKNGQAEEWYQKTAQLDSSISSVQFRLFEYALKKNKTSVALTALKNVFAEADSDQAWSLRVADRFVRHDSLDHGLAFFLQRLPLSSHPQTTNKVLGKLFAKTGVRQREAGNISQAISSYKKALSFDSADTVLYRDLGWFYWLEGQRVLSEKVWRVYREKFPHETEPHNLLAQLYLYQGSYEKSLRAINKSLKIQPGQSDQQLVQVQALFGSKRYAQAMKKAGRMTKEYPEHLPIQYIYGEVLMLYQKFDEGIVQWRKVLDLGSNSPRANFYWIKSLYETGKYQNALHEAKKYLDNHEPYEPVLKLLRDDAEFREDLQETRYWQEKILHQFGDKPGPWLKMSKLYEGEKGLVQASSTLDEAQKIFPDNVEIQLAIGELAIKQKKYEEAMRIFEKIEHNAPGNRRAFMGHHASLVMLNEYSTALEHLKSNKSVFLKNYEIEMASGNILNGMDDFGAGNSRFIKIINPLNQEKYFPILLYHGLSAHPRSRNLWIIHFEEQLKYLKRAGYQTVTVTELERIKAGVMEMPPKPILLTFDDARIDAFRLGDPVLKNFGMKATMFVPADRANHEHPFFANWDMIRNYSKMGRWDIQGHGNQAHDLIPTNATGDKGYFLANLMWNPDGQRLEKDSEFYNRLKRDYSNSIGTIKLEIPGARVSGYAFPFSEAGQTSHGNAKFAQQINEDLLNEYFQFGFIQDLTGYNRIRVNDDKTYLLRRFSVPPNWDGDRLVQHLAENHPAHVAQLALAKSHYWKGQYSEAGKIFSKLVADEPRLKNKVQVYLADISFQGGNYWESENILRDIPLGESILNPKIAKLKEAVAWKNRPRIFGGFDFFHDSNDRTHHSESARIYFPLESPLELTLKGAIVNFEEKGRRDLDGNEVTAGINWSGWKPLRFQGMFRNRDISQKGSSQSYWASAQYSKKQHQVQFDWSDRDIDTVQAIEQGIKVQTVSLGYQARFSPPLLGKVGISYQDYEDGNTAFDLTTRLRYPLPGLKNWKIGADLSYKDSTFETSAYYSPDQLLIGSARVFYQRSFNHDFDLRANYGLGGASDKVNGVRWVTSGGVDLSHRFTRHLKAGLNTKFSFVPGYNSVNLKAFIGYRF